MAMRASAFLEKFGLEKFLDGPRKSKISSMLSFSSPAAGSDVRDGGRSATGSGQYYHRVAGGDVWVEYDADVNVRIAKAQTLEDNGLFSTMSFERDGSHYEIRFGTKALDSPTTIAEVNLQDGSVEHVERRACRVIRVTDETSPTAASVAASGATAHDMADAAAARHTQGATSAAELVEQYASAAVTLGAKLVGEWIDVKPWGKERFGGSCLVLSQHYNKHHECLFEGDVVRDCSLQCKGKHDPLEAQPFRILGEAPAWAIAESRRKAAISRKPTTCGGALNQLEVTLFAARGLDADKIEGDIVCCKVYLKLSQGGEQSTTASARGSHKGNRCCFMDYQGGPPLIILGDATASSSLGIQVKHAPKKKGISPIKNDETADRVVLSRLKIDTKTLTPNSYTVGWLPFQQGAGELQVGLYLHSPHRPQQPDNTIAHLDKAPPAPPTCFSDKPALPPRRNTPRPFGDANSPVGWKRSPSVDLLRFSNPRPSSRTILDSGATFTNEKPPPPVPFKRRPRPPSPPRFQQLTSLFGRSQSPPPPSRPAPPAPPIEAAVTTSDWLMGDDEEPVAPTYNVVHTTVAAVEPVAASADAIAAHVEHLEPPHRPAPPPPMGEKEAVKAALPPPLPPPPKVEEVAPSKSATRRWSTVKIDPASSPTTVVEAAPRRDPSWRPPPPPPRKKTANPPPPPPKQKQQDPAPASQTTRSPPPPLPPPPKQQQQQPEEAPELATATEPETTGSRYDILQGALQRQGVTAKVAGTPRSPRKSSPPPPLPPPPLPPPPLLPDESSTNRYDVLQGALQQRGVVAKVGGSPRKSSPPPPPMPVESNRPPPPLKANAMAMLMSGIATGVELRAVEEKAAPQPPRSSFLCQITAGVALRPKEDRVLAEPAPSEAPADDLMSALRAQLDRNRLNICDKDFGDDDDESDDDDWDD